MLLMDFIIFFEDTIIVQGFDSLGLLQNLLQPFIKNHLPLQVYVHPCLFLVKLPCISFLDWYTLPISCLKSSSSFCYFKRICSISLYSFWSLFYSTLRESFFVSSFQ
jgi:hypothetical protein